MLCTDRFHCVYTEEVSNSVTQSLCKSLFFFWSWSVSGSWKTSCHLRKKYKSLCESVNALHNQHVTNTDHVENSIVSLNPTCSSRRHLDKNKQFFLEIILNCIICIHTSFTVTDTFLKRIIKETEDHAWTK